MGIISSTTGHRSYEERRVARILYISIAIAIIVGFVVTFSTNPAADKIKNQPKPSLEQTTPVQQ